jgi:hypothetical protein
MSTLTPQVGEVARLLRSGHVMGSSEPVTIVSVHEGEDTVVLRVRWIDGSESFVSVGALERSPRQAMTMPKTPRSD